MNGALIAAMFLSLSMCVPVHAADQLTCGQQIPGMAGIPEKLAMGATSVADRLDAHAKFMTANKDKASQAEAKGLKELSRSHQQIAVSMEMVANTEEGLKSWRSLTGNPSGRDGGGRPELARVSLTRRGQHQR